MTHGPRLKIFSFPLDAFGFSPGPSVWRRGLSKNHLKIFAPWKLPDTATMVKRRRDEGLGSCLSTDTNSATPSFAKRVPIQAPVIVKHHGGGLGKCVSKDASASSDNFVSSTSYRCLPGNKITLKTTVLGLALPPKPVSRPNTPTSGKLGIAEATRSDLNHSDSSDEEKKQKRPRVSPSNYR